MILGGDSDPVSWARRVAVPNADIGGIGFGRRGQIDGGLGQRQIAFRCAQEIIGVLGGQRLVDGLGIGKADILDRHADQAARDKERIFPGGQHAREIIKRGIGIGTAYRLVKRRDEIVVAVLRLVVQRHTFLHDLGKFFGIERRRLSAAAEKYLRRD